MLSGKPTLREVVAKAAPQVVEPPIEAFDESEAPQEQEINIEEIPW